MNTLRALLLLAVVFTAPAATVQLGIQHYTDSQFIGGTAIWEVGSAGDVEPFLTFKGGDFSASFSASWTFNFAPGAVTSASTAFGIWDHDSAAPGSQVASFTVDGFDLTALLDAAFESAGGTQAENNIYSVVLPAAALALLSDGVANFSLTLQGSGLQGAPGTSLRTTVNNGAGLDFATLTIEAIPEPASLLLFGCGLAALAFARRHIARS
jgi:hypothetical protein